MSLSPWDISGNIGFDLSTYQPRRPSYVFATTQVTRQRSGSYQHATESPPEHPSPDQPDFWQRKRKGSYREATDGEGDDEVEGDDDDDEEEDEFEGPRDFRPADRTAEVQSTVPNHVDSSHRVVVDVDQDDHCQKDRQMDEELDFRSSSETSPRRPGQSLETVYPGGSCSGAVAKDQDVDADELGNSRWRYIKNLVVLSLSFILVFSAFRSIQNLQSSLNTNGRLGVIAMCCVHGTMCLSCLFSPVLTTRVSPKWTIVAGLVFYLFWIAANFFPHFYTLVPTSIAVGFGQSLAWGAQVAYIERLATEYAEMTRALTRQEVYRSNGIFLACFQTSHVWGNLVSSLMLSGDRLLLGQTTTTTGNETDELENEWEDAGVYCGVYERCKDQSSVWTNPGPVLPASKTLLKMMGSYLVFAFTGFLLILIFLEKLGTSAGPKPPCLRAVVVNLRHLVSNRTYRLLIPLLVFNGFEQGFVYSDYTKSYISCTIGVQYVGYNMITLGMTNSIFSVLVGFAAKHVAREAIVGIGSVLHVGIVVFLLVWIPDQNLVAIFFVISALWGVCDAIWQTQCNTLVNLSCTNGHEVAFQNFRMLQGFGATFAFFLSIFTCVSVKLYILTSLLSLSVLFYVLVEYQLRRQETSSDQTSGFETPAQNRSTT